jgi:hypothetical protein
MVGHGIVDLVVGGLIGLVWGIGIGMGVAVVVLARARRLGKMRP